MERSVEIATGESVAFRHELAGLGSRFLAVLIDFAVQIGVLAALLVALALLVHPGAATPALKWSAIDKAVQATLIAIFAALLFLLFFGYFIFFEWRLAGRTPGKRLVGIRVVRDGGFPLDFTSSAIRNIVRILEFALGFYALSALSALLSPLNRRLGDMAAGTIVVRDERYERTPVFPQARLENERDDAVTRDLTAAERDLIRRYADRRAALKPAARTAVAAEIAALVRPKLRVPFHHLSDDDLLVHLARTAISFS